jgi:hypothetical protein
VKYLLADNLGSTTNVVSSTGGSVSSQQYHPYGGKRGSGGVLNETDKQFTGHQTEGNLYYMQARFYPSLRSRTGSPFVGRFLAPDSR